MKYNKFEITITEEQVLVSVSVLEMNSFNKIGRITIETNEVIEELEKRNIKIGTCIQSVTLKNWKNFTREGTWIFNKPEILDNETLDVILEEEEIPRRRNRRRKLEQFITEEE